MDGEQGFVGDMQAERDRLALAIEHLARSQTALVAAIAEEGDADRAYKTSIEENIVVLARYRARVERLDRELAELRRGRQPLNGAAAVPVAPADGGSGGGGPGAGAPAANGSAAAEEGGAYL